MICVGAVGWKWSQ